MIEKRDVTGERAFSYLKEQLFLSDKTLSSYLIDKVLETGKVFSFVPEDTPVEILFEFDSGGIYPFDKELFNKKPVLIPVENDARPFIMSIIKQYLDDNEENCCIFEDPACSPDDPYITNSKMEYVHIKDEVYYFFDKRNYSDDQFKNAFEFSEGYYFLCSLSSLNIDEHRIFVSSSEISADLLGPFFEAVKFFFVRAYDGEGYLMWAAPDA